MREKKQEKTWTLSENEVQARDTPESADAPLPVAYTRDITAAAREAALSTELLLPVAGTRGLLAAVDTGVAMSMNTAQTNAIQMHGAFRGGFSSRDQMKLRNESGRIVGIYGFETPEAKSHYKGKKNYAVVSVSAVEAAAAEFEKLYQGFTPAVSVVLEALLIEYNEKRQYNLTIPLETYMNTRCKDVTNKSHIDEARKQIQEGLFTLWTTELHTFDEETGESVSIRLLSKTNSGGIVRNTIIANFTKDFCDILDNPKFGFSTPIPVQLLQADLRTTPHVLAIGKWLCIHRWMNYRNKGKDGEVQPNVYKIETLMRRCALLWRDWEHERRKTRAMKSFMQNLKECLNMFGVYGFSYDECVWLSADGRTLSSKEVENMTPETFINARIRLPLNWLIFDDISEKRLKKRLEHIASAEQQIKRKGKAIAQATGKRLAEKIMAGELTSEQIKQEVEQTAFALVKSESN